MTYAILSEGLDREARKDLDWALEADPDGPKTRQKGTGALMGMLASPPGRNRR